MFSWAIDSDRIFESTNPGMKKDHILIKTIFTIKAGTKDNPSHYRSPEEDEKYETRVEH